ncbi:AGE family epimerase/isomerase [Haloarcula brevis]|uniref:AGE family epimerase/isomerase n=1 Tax=Haloarcula brevis TaxID=3111453 RepID=UPI00300F3BEC
MDPDSKYRSAEWLRGQIRDVLNFYYPQCLDEDAGGYVAQFDEETGEVYDRSAKHLVATSRFVVNYCVASTLHGPDWCRSAAEHGLRFLQTSHRDAARGGYHWLLDGREPRDSKRVCYGHAFAFLALARAAEADIAGVGDDMKRLYRLLTDRFWEPEHGLCKSEYDPDWTEAADYRGQNANMHMCEALIAAYEATGDRRYLERAETIAEALTVELAAETDGLVWEHYASDWEHDFDYNRNDPRHTFRPWGYQPGHQIEWAKLLAVLARHSDEAWLGTRAEELFEAAIACGWDDDDGGFYYTVDLDLEPLVRDKYSWAVAEAIGAAAALYDVTGDTAYRTWYDTFWQYADANLVNQDLRNWYTKVTEANDPVPTQSGVAVEPGYHPIGACLEGIRSFA